MLHFNHVTLDLWHNQSAHDLYTFQGIKIAYFIVLVAAQCTFSLNSLRFYIHPHNDLMFEQCRWSFIDIVKARFSFHIDSWIKYVISPSNFQRVICVLGGPLGSTKHSPCHSHNAPREQQIACVIQSLVHLCGGPESG